MNCPLIVSIPPSSLHPCVSQNRGRVVPPYRLSVEALSVSALMIGERDTFRSLPSAGFMAVY